MAKNEPIHSLCFLHDILCGLYTQSQRHRYSYTHPNFVFYFPSAAVSNDAFPLVNFSEPEGAPAVATFFASLQIHTTYALNTPTNTQTLSP